LLAEIDEHTLNDIDVASAGHRLRVKSALRTRKRRALLRCSVMRVVA
jgi:hypothetical protein